MTPDKNGGELKPCPFCKKQVEYFDEIYVHCNCNLVGVYELNKWQNAYCWQELDKVKAQRDRLRVICKQIALILKLEVGGILTKEQSEKILNSALQGAGEGE